MKKNMRYLLLLGGMVAWPEIALAAEPPVIDPWVSGVKAIGALLTVLAIILVGYALARKGVPFLPGQKEGAIKVVEWRSLGGKKALCLVKVRGQELLLGVGTEQISLLTPVENSSNFENALEEGMRNNP